MKKSGLLLILILSQAFSSNCQSGFYRNFFNTFGSKNFKNGPQITSLSPLSNNCFILTTAENDQDISTACIAKLDSSFKLLWAKAFKMKSGGFLDYAIELEDSSLVGLAFPDLQLGGIFYRINKYGNLMVANSYVDGSSNYPTSRAICKSNSNDTGIVTIIGECSIYYGLAKFNNNGKVLWANDYSSNNIGVDVYTILQGFKHGYISTFGIIESTRPGLYAGVAHVGNSGQFIRARKYSCDPMNSNLTDISSTFLSKDSSYYIGIGTGHYFSSTQSRKYDNDAYILNLDTSLLIRKSWRFTTQDKDQGIIIMDFANTSGKEIIINGRITDSISPDQLFILKFDPTDNGKILWCKTFNKKSGYQHKIATSWPIRGMHVYNDKDDIVLPIYTGFDGSCLGGLNSSGELLCNTSDINILVSKWDKCTSSSVPLNPRAVNLTQVNRKLEDTIINYYDSLICYNNSTAVDELKVESKQEICYKFSIQNLNLKLSNLLNQPIKIIIYSLEGEQIYFSNLKEHSYFDFTFIMPGIYLINAYSISKVQNSKIIVY